MAVTHHNPEFIATSSLQLDYNYFAQELSEANYALGLLEGSQKNLQNAKLLVAPLSAKEATVSSKIEGTVSTVGDVFLYEAGGRPSHSDTLQVVNYRHAIFSAMDHLIKGRKVSTHLIESLHGILLSRVPHQGKVGKFRQHPVWISGKNGTTIEQANYVPPEHFRVRDYMDDLISYIHKAGEDPLIKAGIAHYQFEAIHPFNDGNGRLGRLLIPLILFYEKKLSTPILYISGYMEEHRNEYMSSLHEVDRTGKYETWLKFFLQCVAKQLLETQALVTQINNLYSKTKDIFPPTKSPFLIPFVDFLFENPFFTKPVVQKKLNINTYATVNHLVTLFREKKFIMETGAKSGRAKLYAFNPLLELL